jgi:hypothetical protein
MDKRLFHRQHQSIQSAPSCDRRDANSSGNTTLKFSMKAGRNSKGGRFTHPAANSASSGKRNITEIERVEWYTGPWPPVVNAYRSEYWENRTYATKFSNKRRIARKRKRGGGNLPAAEGDDDDNGRGTMEVTVSFDSSCWVLLKGKLCPRIRANASARPNSSYSLRANTSNRLLTWQLAEFRGSRADDEYQLWDPARAAQAIKKGEKVEDFLAQAKELNMTMLCMEALHRSSYNVKAARKAFGQTIDQTPETYILQPSLIRDKVLEALNSSDQISAGKKFTQVARQLGCRNEMLLVHYYIWKSTTCAVCNESGGHIVECPSCYAPYHSSCTPGRGKRASKVLYFQPCSHCGIAKHCHGSKVCSPTTLAVQAESAIHDISIPNHLQGYKDSASYSSMRIAIGNDPAHADFTQSHPPLVSPVEVQGPTVMQSSELHQHKPEDAARFDGETSRRDNHIGTTMNAVCDHGTNEALPSPGDAALQNMVRFQVCHCRHYRRSQGPSANTQGN